MILLTGATGFIGTHLLRQCGDRFDFRCLARPSWAGKIKPGPHLEIIPGDLLSEDSIKTAMRGVDTVLHMGALVRTSTPEEIYRVNLEGTRRLVSEALRQKVSRFIFISTENALREDLRDAYAVSKREAEAVVKTFKNHLILRPCFVYGQGDDHGLGRLIGIVQKSPVVPLFGGLECEIQPIYIADMVEYLIRALEKPLQGEYIIAGPETLPLNDFLKEVCRVRGEKRFQLMFPRFFFRMAAAVCDRLPASVGWGTNQFNNIYNSRTYSMEKTVKDFEYSPRSVREGLTEWFTASESLKKAVLT